MAKEKLSINQKMGLAELNPTGKDVDAVSKIAEVGKSTAYKGLREGKLYKHIEAVEQKNRELFVENQLLKSALASKNNGKKSARHS